MKDRNNTESTENKSGEKSAPGAKDAKDAQVAKKPFATSNLPVRKVIVHPLVLLSVVDHYYRVSKRTNVKRVIGILLGSQRENKETDIANSFAVPFDETDSKVYFIDEEYLENMYNMFKKVNARETIVGWYHTGPTLKPNDINVNSIIKKHNPNAILLIVDIRLQKDTGLPTDAYIEVEQIHDDGTPPTKTFEHVPCDIGAEEAEEVGVEHLLRDIKDQTAGTLSQRVTDKFLALIGMREKLQFMEKYLKNVADNKQPFCHNINYIVQDIINMLPDTMSPEFVKSNNFQTNDQMLMMYMGSLARSVVSLHNLINNKISLREAEKTDTDKAKESLGTKKDAAAAVVVTATGSGDAKKEEQPKTEK